MPPSFGTRFEPLSLAMCTRKRWKRVDAYTSQLEVVVFASEFALSSH